MKKHPIPWEEVVYAKASEGAAEAWFPTNGWEAALVIAGVLLTVVGIRWVGWHRENRLGRGLLALAAGLGIMSFVLIPRGIHFHYLPHAHWLYAVLILVPWFIVKWTTWTNVDDATFKTIIVFLCGVSLALRGLFGVLSPSAVFWWLLVTTWVLALSEAVLEELELRPSPRNLLLLLGWYLLAVLA